MSFRNIVDKKKILFSITFAILLTCLNYWVCNTSISLPDEMKVLRLWDKVEKIMGWSNDGVPDDVLLIDVAYDKQLVDYSIDSIPVGQYAITDRQKLLDFLTIANRAGNYRYIMLDVVFEKGYKSPQDSALFNLIASMERIIIPVHSDIELEDSILYTKAANADYTITWEETDFARFQFLHEGSKSMPLKMYEDLYGNTISRCGFLYYSNGWICRNAITLKLPIKLFNNTSKEDKLFRYNSLYLGTDLLALDSISPISNEINNKLIVIGNFRDDIHETYIGRQPGSLICLNAFYALKNGDHIIWGQYGSAFLFYVFIVTLYFVLSMLYINGYSLSVITERMWLQLLLSLLSVNMIFWIIAFVAYVSPLKIVYNIWIPILAFSILDFTTNIYSKLQNKRL